jgi:Putative peptidoglycan binding domain
VRRQIADDDEMPRRRRRSARAAAIEAADERGLVMRILLHSPKDMVAGALAFAAAGAIIANALFLQAGRHPSPMFGTVAAMPAAVPAPVNPLPRPRPLDVAARAIEPPAAPEPKPVEAKSNDSKNNDPMTNLVVKATGAAPAAGSNVARPPAPIPSRETTQSTGSRRVAAVQRALTEYGYGQLKPTGTIGADTQAAIQKFERERKIPVTGQMSDRLVRELTAVIGRPVD